MLYITLKTRLWITIVVINAVSEETYFMFTIALLLKYTNTQNFLKSMKLCSKMFLKIDIRLKYTVE